MLSNICATSEFEVEKVLYFQDGKLMKYIFQLSLSQAMNIKSESLWVITNAITESTPQIHVAMLQKFQD